MKPQNVILVDGERVILTTLAAALTTWTVIEEPSADYFRLSDRGLIELAMLGGNGRQPPWRGRDDRGRWRIRITDRGRAALAQASAAA
jgi:hypothetical protein